MTSRSRVSLWLTPVAVAMIALLGACATPAPSESPGSQSGGKIIPPETYFGQPAEPIPAPGEVFGVGTVIHDGDSAPQLCLGPVRESYPPQCSGPEVVGWEWNGIDGHETSGSITWGAYAVTGNWDGELFTNTRPPIMLALYDTVAFVDPYLDPANPGSSPQAKLLEIQTALNGSTSYLPLSTHIENGYLFAAYSYDDGRRQHYLNEAYGEDVVIVRSALQDVSS